MQKIRVGVVGCGAISGAYFKHAAAFENLQMAACADLNPEAAASRAREFSVPRVLAVDELINDPQVDVVLNLTIPKAHAAISLQALSAGKHVYVEKPLGITRDEGRRIMETAAAKKLLVGCAPDTVLGSGIQTARRMIDDGAIGKPVAFTAFMMCPGHESWHPNPEFYYQPGGGPMFDMGPYYLSALLTLLGPVKRINAFASIAIPQRTIGSAPKRGTKITVETPDHVCGAMEFAGGCVGTIVTSFATRFPSYDGKQPITIFGTEGTLRVPDPNGFDGIVSLRKNADETWADIAPATPGGYGRAVGLADLADALRTGRAVRAGGELGFAVLDLMQGFLESSASGNAYTPVARFTRPAPMPATAGMF